MTHRPKAHQKEDARSDRDRVDGDVEFYLFLGNIGVDQLTTRSPLLLLQPNPNSAGRGDLDVKNSIALKGTDYLATQFEFGT